MKKKIITLLAALAVAVGLAVAGPAGTAQAAVSAGYVGVNVRADLSQSNMLFSFEYEQDHSISQTIVCEGCYYGEGGNVLIFSEPQRMWTNAGWCSGYRYLITDTRYNFTTTTGWWYQRGGYNGVSTYVNPKPNFVSNVPEHDIYTIEAYLVPVGVAGCTY